AAAGCSTLRAARRWTALPREPRDVTALRDTVCALHAELVRNGLVAWTSGHADRTPLPRRADAQPRRVHHRRQRAGRGQGRRDVRGRGADGTPGPRLRRAGAAARGPGGRAVRPLPEPLRPALTADKEKS